MARYVINEQMVRGVNLIENSHFAYGQGGVAMGSETSGGIRNARHQPIQRIDLADQMTLAEPSDRGIAGHRANGCEPMRHQRRSGTHARRGARGLAAGVASADDDDVE